MFRRVEILIGPETKETFGCTNGIWGAGSVASHGMAELRPQSRRGMRYRENRHLRFFFTEIGWRRFGHAVLSGARAEGLRARVIVRKERDPHIQVYYRDRWQVMIGYSRSKRPEPL